MYLKQILDCVLEVCVGCHLPEHLLSSCYFRSFIKEKKHIVLIAALKKISKMPNLNHFSFYFLKKKQLIHHDALPIVSVDALLKAAQERVKKKT